MVIPSEQITKKHIQNGLRKVGIENGDVVFVHSSLSSFGHVEGAADTVIDALVETVGNEGTIVMPAFTWENFHDKEEVIFDLTKTP